VGSIGTVGNAIFSASAVEAGRSAVASNRLLSSIIARLLADRRASILLRMVRWLSREASNRLLSSIVARLLANNSPSILNERAILPTRRKCYFWIGASFSGGIGF